MKGAGCAILVLSTLWRGAAAESPDRSTGEEFQDIAIQATRDMTVPGRRTIDSYWRARGAVSGDPLTNELYQGLEGGHVARARLSGSGWELHAPETPLVLAVNRPSDDTLVVITNATLLDQEVQVTGGHADPEVIPVKRIVRANSSAGVWLGLLAKHSGRLWAQVRMEAGPVAASMSIPCEARASGLLSVRVLDAQGRLSAARVFLNGPDSFHRAPEGAFERVMWMTGEHYFYTMGSFALTLPAGEGTVEILKGFEYWPAKARFTIRAGENSEVVVRLKRVADMPALGWISGDDHIHGNYRGQKQWTTPKDDLLVIQAEDLHLANMVVSNSDGAFLHDERYFSGKGADDVSTQQYKLYWNEEMRNRSMYGHLLFFGLREMVRPVYSGFPGTPNTDDWPSNGALAANARRQGAIAMYAHPALKLEAFPSGSDARESVVDVSLGTIDALEVFCSQEEAAMRLWYRFLNCGFPLGISGGSDAFLNQSFAFVAGGDRVYVQAGQRSSQAEWIAGLRRGRAFATVGPLVFFTAQHRPPGERLSFDHGPVRLPVSVRAISIIPMSRLEIVANGRVLRVAHGDAESHELKWSGTIQLDQSSWIAARVWGPNHRLIANGPSRWAEWSSSDVLLAHTGATWVTIAGKRSVSGGDLDYLLRWTDELTADLRANGRFSTPERRKEVERDFEAARKVYESLRD